MQPSNQNIKAPLLQNQQNNMQPNIGMVQPNVTFAPQNQNIHQQNVAPQYYQQQQQPQQVATNFQTQRPTIVYGNTTAQNYPTQSQNQAGPDSEDSTVALIFLILGCCCGILWPISWCMYSSSKNKDARKYSQVSCILFVVCFLIGLFLGGARIGMLMFVNYNNY